MPALTNKEYSKIVVLITMGREDDVANTCFNILLNYEQ